MNIERIRLGNPSSYSRQVAERIETEHKQTITPEAVSSTNDQKPRQEPQHEQGESGAKPHEDHTANPDPAAAASASKLPGALDVRV